MIALMGNIYSPLAFVPPRPFAYIGYLICLEMFWVEITFCL